MRSMSPPRGKGVMPLSSRSSSSRESNDGSATTKNEGEKVGAGVSGSGTGEAVSACVMKATSNVIQFETPRPTYVLPEGEVNSLEAQLDPSAGRELTGLV